MDVKSTEILGKVWTHCIKETFNLGKVPELISLKELFHEIAFDQNSNGGNWHKIEWNIKIISQTI